MRMMGSKTSVRFFFFQAEDGIRDHCVTGVQTCALPISLSVFYVGRLMRHTKIIATVGPASNSDTVLDALIAAGTDIFRLNFSHGTHESHRAAFAAVRAAAVRAHREVAILQDLGGPKIRTGKLYGGRSFTVKAGDKLTIATGDFIGGPGRAGDPSRISTTFAGLAQSVKPGERRRD